MQTPANAATGLPDPDWMFVSYAHTRGFGCVATNHQPIRSGYDIDRLAEQIQRDQNVNDVVILTWRNFDTPGCG